MLKFEKEKDKKFLVYRKYFYYIILFLKNIYSFIIKYIRKIIFCKLFWLNIIYNIFIYLFIFINKNNSYLIIL